ncbi:hypothetical protein JL2886_00481 [Phaeobacter gallaeciensis]|jgi:hypothetical protein|uniref:Uncharacterized protein n=1 Tax=Phaeobacter gallaeciensis TaxID=60890 RepID=A0A1B0ZMK9_9RHOB|nr:MULTISPECIES: hypothetical protein [Phaeobacter]MDF1771167.1 hypothetical protein [Pseudophaeobacter sp. bin_em_oilr2.035]MEE2634310.1 hypothetical protein [Pseudomonadota bacterium]ANP35412.1 hypothetical protein JL2886_00481 [Phaeobacter gallaeciensis]MDE4062042.1 hypothetical protein [Phaeobacter gallaeciensis]MDE4125011.1 hypothetical protein [Phaeobacter gallaeciensis]
MIRGDGAGRQDEISAPFVERRTYRRRRLMDIARLLPILGALLFLMPLMWPDPDPYPAPGSHGGMAMSSAIIYIFVVWAILIAVSLAFGEAVRRWAEHWTAGGHSEAEPYQAPDAAVGSGTEQGSAEAPRD